MISGILEEKWRRKERSRGWSLSNIAREAKKFALITGGFRTYGEIMDFQGNILGKFRTKNPHAGTQPTDPQITSDASRVYILSGDKIFAYNSNGKKLKEYKCDGGSRSLSISEDGSMVTGGGKVMDTEGNVLFGSMGKHMVIDAFSKKPAQIFFVRAVLGIAPNGSYLVAHESAGQKEEYFLRSYSATYTLQNIYLFQSMEKQGSQRTRCVPYNRNRIEYGAKVCVHNLFFACAGKSIGFFGLDGNLKWTFPLHDGEVKQFYVTSDAKYVFFTLKGRKNRKNIYMLDAENRNIVETTLEKTIRNFKVTDNGRELFVHTESPTKVELVAFDVK